MAVDVLGQEIEAGNRVLWAGHGQMGFNHGRPLEVVRVTQKRAYVVRPGLPEGSPVIPECLVVVDRLLGGAQLG